MTSDLNSREDPFPTVFRCDYPPAAVDNWAVLWEVADEDEFCKEQGRPTDPTTVTENGWIAVTKQAVQSLDDMR